MTDAEPAQGDRSDVMADGQWWYCIQHTTVEGDEVACKAVDRLGPYASREEASHALEKVAQRNEAWDAQDDWGED